MGLLPSMHLRPNNCKNTMFAPFLHHLIYSFCSVTWVNKPYGHLLSHSIRSLLGHVTYHVSRTTLFELHSKKISFQHRNEFFNWPFQKYFGCNFFLINLELKRTDGPLDTFFIVLRCFVCFFFSLAENLKSDYIWEKSFKNIEI